MLWRRRMLRVRSLLPTAVIQLGAGRTKESVNGAAETYVSLPRNFEVHRVGRRRLAADLSTPDEGVALNLHGLAAHFQL